MKREEAQKKRRALVYARVSKAEMVNAEFCSLDGQQERCESYAKAFGWDVVDRFRDASTGGNTERPDLQRLLERIAARDCDTLLVYKIDRLSRSVLDFWQLFETLRGHGCDLVSVTESFDSSTPQGRLMLNILAGFAEFEREQIRARTKQGLASRAAAGYWPARWQPFGYDRVPTSGEEGAPMTLKPNGDAGRVGEVFRRFLDGDGPQLIADTLNADGVGGPHGEKWSGRVVVAMLRNPVYIGRVLWNGQSYAGRHKGIVGAELWEAVQARLAAGQRGQSRKPRTAGVEGADAPALVGVVRDAGGEPFKRYWAKGSTGVVTFYYQDPVTGQRINAREFDRELLRALRATVGSPEFFAGTLDAARQEVGRRERELDARVEGLKAKLAALEGQERRLVDAVAGGTMAPEHVAGKLREIAEAKQRVNDALAECEGERASIRQAAQDVGMWRDLRAYLDAAQGNAEFLDVAAVLRAVVREVRLDLGRGRARVVFNLACAAAESIGRKADSDSEAEGGARHVVAAVGGGTQGMVGDSKWGYGEGDGARTRNHQIDNLVL